jgi:hypothetical protein
VEPSTPLLRCKVIETLSLGLSFEGWTLAVDHGIDETDPITLGGCKVDKFRITPSEGGSVDIAFRVGSNDVDATEAGLLCSHLGQSISFTLKAPEVKKPEPAAIDGTKGHPGAADAAQGDLLADGQASKAALDATGKNPFGDGKSDDHVRTEALVTGKPAGEKRGKAAPANVE